MSRATHFVWLFEIPRSTDQERFNSLSSLRDACDQRPFPVAEQVDTVVKFSPLMRFTAAVYLTASVCLTCFVSWSLLTPDPFAILRDSSLAWLEQVSDRIIHTAVFTAISFAWFGLFPVLRREIPPITIFALLAYSISMEAFQAFVPGRHCCAPDAICNIAGFVFGLSAVRLIEQMLRPWQTPANLSRS